MSYNKEQRTELMEQGLCIHCGKEPVIPPNTRCPECFEKARISNQKRVLRLKGQLLCIVCGKVPPLPRMDRCQTCTDIQKVRQKERYNSLKHKGTCMGCGKTGIPLNRVRCEECQEKANKRHKIRFDRLKDQGLCSLCGKFPPIEGKTICTNCLQYNKEINAQLRKQREELGLCKTCGKPAAPGHKDCEICLRHGRETEAKKRLNHPDQKIRERDGFKCRLCGGIGSRLIVHHIDGSGIDGRNRKRSKTANDDPSNLITLCDSCHYRIHKIVRFSLDIDLAIFLIQSLTPNVMD